MAKAKKVRETYAETIKSGADPVDKIKLADLLARDAVTGYVQRQGVLSDGNYFSQLYLVIDKDKLDANEIE